MLRNRLDAKNAYVLYSRDMHVLDAGQTLREQAESAYNILSVITATARRTAVVGSHVVASWISETLEAWVGWVGT